MTLLRNQIVALPPKTSGVDQSSQLRFRSFPLADPGEFAMDDDGNVWVLNSSRGGDYCQGGVRYNTRTGDWDDYFHIAVQDTNARKMSAITFANGHVWVWDLTQEELWAYNPKTREAPFLAYSLAVTASSEIRELIPGGGYLWLGLSGGGTGGTVNALLRIDISDPSSVTATVTADFGTYAAFGGVFGMVYDNDQSLVWFGAKEPASLYYQDATSIVTTPSTVALTNLTEPRGVALAGGFVWVAGESSANGNVWLWKVNASTKTEVTSYDLGWASDYSWVEPLYDPRRGHLWLNDNNVPAMKSFDIATGALTGTSHTTTGSNIRRAALVRDNLWTCRNAAGDPANSVVQRDDTNTGDSEVWDGLTSLRIARPSQGFVVNDSTTNGSMIPDDVDLVVVDLSAGNTKTIYLPPFVQNPTLIQNPDVDFLRAQGRTVTFVDVGGTLGQASTAVKVVGTGTGAGGPAPVLHGAKSAITSEVGVYWFQQAYGSVTFRYDSRAAVASGFSNPATYGRWFCINDSRPWVDQVITTGSTIPLGRVRCLMQTTGTLFLQDPQGGGSEAYWGSECLIKTGPSVVTVKIDAVTNGTDIEGANDYWIDHPNGWVHLAYLGGTGWTIVGSGPYNEDRAMQDDLTATPTNNFAPVDSAGAVPWSRATILVLGAPTSDRTLTGITALPSGVQRKKLINQGPNNILLTHSDVGSLASNRFYTSTGATATVGPDEMIDIVYDEQISRWRVNG